MRKNYTKKLFGRALVRIRAKIEGKITLFGRALVRDRAKIENYALFGKALVKVRAKID